MPEEAEATPSDSEDDGWQLIADFEQKIMSGRNKKADQAI
jgi:hypothetical protein